MGFVSTGMVVALSVGWMAVVGIRATAQTPPAQPSQNTEAKSLKNPLAATPESVAAGRQVFAKFCVLCHGQGGKGDGTQPPPGAHPANLTDQEWLHGSSDGEIFATIRDGVGPDYNMDGYDGRIKEPDIWNLVNYIRSIGPPPKPQ